MARKKSDIGKLVKRFTFDPLPKGFVLAKPVKQEAYDEAEIYELEKSGGLIITRKRNGWKLFAVKDKDQWKLYTDGLREVTFLDHIKKELDRSRPASNGTVLVGEAVVPDAKNGDALNRVQSVFGSSPDRALEKQKELGQVKYRLFDIMFLNKAPVFNCYAYSWRLMMLDRMFGSNQSETVAAVEKLNVRFDEAKEQATREGWEGLVLYDKLFISSFRLDGKDPQRIRGCYKWKPIKEDDFIVRWWVGDDDKHPRYVKEVLLSQIDPVTKTEFDCGKFGLFTKEMREKLMDSKLYPFVLELRFDERFESGKLQAARFVRTRDDKKVDDCISPVSYPKATPFNSGPRKKTK